MGEEEGYIDGLRCIEGSIKSAEAEALEVCRRPPMSNEGGVSADTPPRNHSSALPCLMSYCLKLDPSYQLNWHIGLHAELQSQQPSTAGARTKCNIDTMVLRVRHEAEG